MRVDCTDLSQSDDPFLGPHDTTLQHNEVIPHDTIVMESTLQRGRSRYSNKVETERKQTDNDGKTHIKSVHRQRKDDPKVYKLMYHWCDLLLGGVELG